MVEAGLRSEILEIHWESKDVVWRGLSAMAIPAESPRFNQPTAQLPEWQAMAERVRASLEREFPNGPPPGIDLEEISRTAVADLEGARFRAFVPVLALRAARATLAGLPLDA
jgi:hypothetical protein